MTKTPEHKLAELVLQVLQEKGPDAFDRLTDILEAAAKLGFGEENGDAIEDTDPWLIPKGMGYMTCSHTHCLAEIIGRPGDLCDDCKDADEGVTSCNGCDNDG
jgi:hypothetical protein